MKKLLILCLVLSMTSAALALPYFRVDPLDKKDHYQPSDYITIQLMDDDGGVVDFFIDAIIDNGAGGTAHEPQVFNGGFGGTYPGQLNYDGKLVAYVGAVDDLIPIDGFLYSFVYHVPDVPASTLISIESYADDLYWEPEFDYYDGSFYEGPVYMAPGEEIHVIPEPATLALLGLGALMLKRRK